MPKWPVQDPSRHILPNMPKGPLRPTKSLPSMPGMQNIVWQPLSNALPHRPFPLRLPGMPAATPKLIPTRQAILRNLLQTFLLRLRRRMHALHSLHIPHLPGRPPPPTMPSLHRRSLRPMHKRNHAHPQRNMVLYSNHPRRPKLSLQLAMQSRLQANAPPNLSFNLSVHTRRSLHGLVGINFTQGAYSKSNQ